MIRYGRGVVQRPRYRLLCCLGRLVASEEAKQREGIWLTDSELMQPLFHVLRTGTQDFDSTQDTGEGIIHYHFAFAVKDFGNLR